MRSSRVAVALVVAVSAVASSASPLGWLLGRDRVGAFAANCRRLEREAAEFESNERVLFEQLRQMRLTTGALRTSLRESVAKSEESIANATAYVKTLEADVAALRLEVAAADAAVATLTADNAALTKDRDAAAKEAARLKKSLAKAHADLAAVKKAAKAPPPKAAAKAATAPPSRTAKKTASPPSRASAYEEASSAPSRTPQR